MHSQGESCPSLLNTLANSLPSAIQSAPQRLHKPSFIYFLPLPPPPAVAQVSGPAYVFSLKKYMFLL